MIKDKGFGKFKDTLFRACRTEGPVIYNLIVDSRMWLLYHYGFSYGLLTY
jgi:hypothetical protein